MLDICFMVLLDYAKELGKDPDDNKQLRDDIVAKKRWLDTAPKGSYDVIFEALRLMEKELGV
jgi:hypothetical protein